MKFDSNHIAYDAEANYGTYSGFFEQQWYPSLVNSGSVHEGYLQHSVMILWGSWKDDYHMVLFAGGNPAMVEFEYNLCYGGSFLRSAY